MNAAAIYAKSTGQKPEPSDEEVQQQVAKVSEEQEKKNAKEIWRRHPLTQQFFAELHTEITNLDEKARDLALSYPTSGNHDMIIQTLTRSATLRKLIEESN